MKNKILWKLCSLFLAMALVLTLAGCGGNSGNSVTQSSTSSKTSSSDSVAAEEEQEGEAPEVSAEEDSETQQQKFEEGKIYLSTGETRTFKNYSYSLGSGVSKIVTFNIYIPEGFSYYWNPDEYSPYEYEDEDTPLLPRIIYGLESTNWDDIFDSNGRTKRYCPLSFGDSTFQLGMFALKDVDSDSFATRERLELSPSELFGIPGLVFPCMGGDLSEKYLIDKGDYYLVTGDSRNMKESVRNTLGGFVGPEYSDDDLKKIIESIEIISVE